MADHLGDGGKFTRISNEILEALAKAKLNGTQYAICLAVVRFTFGFGRCEAKLSAGFLAENTGTNARQIKRELQVLINRNIIVKSDSRERVVSIIGFNKDISTWNLVSNPSLVTNSPPEVVSNTTPDLVSNPSPKKERKENIKEIYILSARQIFDHWNQQNITVHKNITSDIEKSVASALKKYDLPTIKLAITRYATIYHDQAYYFKYKWALPTFLKQKNCIPDFLDEGDKWINYQDKRGSPQEYQSKAKAALEKMM